MLRTVGWILVVVGSALAGAAVVLAVLEIGQLYTDTLNDPLADSAEPKDQAADILKLVALAVPGLLISLVGTGLLFRARLARSRQGLLTPKQGSSANSAEPASPLHRMTPRMDNVIDLEQSKAKAPSQAPKPNPRAPKQPKY